VDRVTHRITVPLSCTDELYALRNIIDGAVAFRAYRHLAGLGVWKIARPVEPAGRRHESIALSANGWRRGGGQWPASPFTAMTSSQFTRRSAAASTVGPEECHSECP
jgi:hypothetical protein